MPSVPCIWKTRPATFESPNFGPLRNKRHRRRLPTLIFRYPATSCSFSSPSAGCFGREGGFVVGRSPAVALAGADAGWRFRLCPGLSRIIDILMTGLDTITKIINSPPGQLAAGGVLAGIVWKFFERVEAVLTDQTKLEIAVWLLGGKVGGPKVQPWPDTFAKVFDRVFGSRHISVRCFGLSALISFAVGILLTIYAPSPYRTMPLAIQVREAFKQSAVTLLCGKVVADYFSLLSTRFTDRKSV